MDGRRLFEVYIEQGKEIVVFCGAGLSKNIGLPNWNELASQLIRDIGQEFGLEEIESLITSMDRGYIDLLSGLDVISDGTYRKRVYDILKEKLSVKGADLTIYQQILSFSSKVLTTNYDNGFELASENKIETFTHDDNYSIANSSKKNSFIFKIHGDLNKPETCVLFKNDYEKLYLGENSYIFELLKNFTDKTLVFIGFSLKDPYINQLFDRFHGVYGSMIDKHFIVTTEPSAYDKYKDYLLPIKIEKYSVLPSLLLELKPFNRNNEQNNEREIAEEKTVASSKTVQILIPNPIDKKVEFNRDLIAGAFTNLNITLLENFFNLDTLVSNEEVEYIFIFTTVIKGQIVIEDDGLKYKLINLSELNILQQCNLKGVFLFVDSSDASDVDLNDFDVNVPVLVIPTSVKKTKETLKGIIYKAFVKCDINLFASNGKIFNEKDYLLQEIKKGNCIRKKPNAIISKLIDRKNLIKFVGRKTDQENIIRKILSMRYENKILTIKGSGGIGKTSIISKIAIDLADRGYFEKGIHFISCNPIQSFENFEFYISQCFNLPSSKLLEDQITENSFFKDRIIILDNFETLLYVQESDQILKLVSFLCDYAIIVITTRQILDLEFEEIFELRNLTTDEGVELFKNVYNSAISEKDEVFLRKEIVERLLNNNPLAIKLIAKGLPSAKNLHSLKEELEENLFRNENIDEIFEKDEDLNIEKSNSLFHSINYSYINLSEKEKLAFELLSLFPDGLHMENFKTFFKSAKNSSNRIGDKEIKQLDDKSLLENSNGFLKLQSIISRFSYYKFKSRPIAVRQQYYETAFDFNVFFINIIRGTSKIGSSTGLLILDLNTNNYLKCLEYMELTNHEQREKLLFIFEVSKIFKDTNQPNKFISSIEKVIPTFDQVYQPYFDIIINNLIYWTRDFDNTLHLIEETYTSDRLVSLDLQNPLDKKTLTLVMAIYKAEGRDLDVIKIFSLTNNFDYSPNDSLFKLGLEAEALIFVPKNKDDKEYFEFEIDFANGVLNIDELNKYIKSLYKKESLEMTQLMYLKSKVTGVSNSEIKKLIISNPYTKGLVYFMQAKNEKDISTKINLFEEAKKSLYHIKFHYVECLIEYATLLKKQGNIELYSENWKEAMEISKKYFFRRKIYMLEELHGIDLPEYSNLYYKLPIDDDQIDNFLRNIIKNNKDYYDIKMDRFEKNIKSLKNSFILN